MFIKTIFYDDKVDKYSIELEAELQSLASNFEFTPKVYNTIFDDDRGRIIMEKIEGKTIAQIYGTNHDNVPEEIWEEITDILQTLYDEELIEYIDISPYNFMIKDDKVFIIDFEHAYYINNNIEINWFLKDFFNGLNEWNPDFF